MQHPEDDGYLSKALQASGYLTVWQKEFVNSPWHYDFEFMKQLGARTEDGHEQMTWYCRTTVEGAAEGRRYEINGAEYALLAKMTESETLRLLAELYGTLDRLHMQRVRVARQWLQESHQPNP